MPYNSTDDVALFANLAATPMTPPRAAFSSADVEDPAIAAQGHQLLAELGPTIERNADVEAAAARADVLATNEAKLIGTVLDTGITPAAEKRDTAVALAAANVRLSEAGRREAVDAADEVFGQAWEAIGSRVLGGEGDRLLAKFSALNFPVPPADLLALAQTTILLFPHAGAGAFWLDGLGCLRLAVTAKDARDQLANNQLLRFSYGPLFIRQAAHPAKYAEAWRSDYVEGARLMQLHLSTVLKASHARVAVAFVDAARTQFRFLRGLIATTRPYDAGLAHIAAPVLAGAGVPAMQ